MIKVLVLLFVSLCCVCVTNAAQLTDVESAILSKKHAVNAPLTKTKTATPIIAVDKVVAYVDQGVVTEDQVAKTVAETVKNFSSQGIIPPPVSVIRQRVIEELIMRKIQVDLAKLSGVKVTDADIDFALHNIAQSHNMTVDQFKQFLMHQGIIYSEFIKQVKEQIMIDRLKQGEVDSHVIVTDQEVNLILNSEAYKNQIDYNLNDIIINIPNNAPFFVIQQKEKLADAAYAALTHGTPFYQVAAKYSNAPNALKGGNLGWRSSVALPPMILDNIANLPLNGYTRPLRLSVGLFIFQVHAIRKHNAPQMVKQYHVRHILIKVNSLMSNDEAYARIYGIYQVLMADKNNPVKQNADFIKYAKAYSEDTSSINGGDIGWVSVGDTVPAFESAMLGTSVGQISRPLRSPFGWHILQVLGVREKNLATEREKAEIRKAIFDSKAAERYNMWLHEIRDTAYVKCNNSAGSNC